MFSAMISQTISNNRLLAKPPRFLLVNVEFATVALPNEDNNGLYKLLLKSILLRH